MVFRKSGRTGIFSQLSFMLNRLRERLWVKPLFMCLLSVVAVFMAGQVDHLSLDQNVPDISKDTIETLLSILSASMLVIAMFAVGAMLSAYASASSATTPRAFSVVVADDVSQNALSVYLGAFIFSVVALIALLNDYYEIAGRFSLFLLTIAVFSIVIASFVRWMDRIARLGRTGTIVHKVEAATLKSLLKARQHPTLGAKLAEAKVEGQAFYGQAVGYVQRVNLADLQALADKHQCHFTLTARPGIFASPGQPLLFIQGQSSIDDDLKTAIENTFVVADNRTFNDDPRFGLIVLSEIASHALSPGINDPGTAIGIIGTLVRLFSRWAAAPTDTEVLYPRISVAAIAVSDMFDDAFNGIARDGAGTLAVAIRLQKAFSALAALDDRDIRAAAKHHAHYALRHAQKSLPLDEDMKKLTGIGKSL